MDDDEMEQQVWSSTKKFWIAVAISAFFPINSNIIINYQSYLQAVMPTIIIIKNKKFD